MQTLLSNQNFNLLQRCAYATCAQGQHKPYVPVFVLPKAINSAGLGHVEIQIYFVGIEIIRMTFASCPAKGYSISHRRAHKQFSAICVFFCCSICTDDMQI